MPPFLGQALSYIYDFGTYKKKWDVKIDFSRIEKKNDFSYFTIYVTNNTFYHVNIGKIKVENGEVFIGFPEHTNSGEIKKGYVEANGERFDYGWKKLSPSNHTKPDMWHSNETEIWIKFKGEKTKILVEYEMADFPRSIFLNSKRVANRIIPF